VNYIDYLYDKVLEVERIDAEIEYSHSLYLKLTSREYMENGRTSTKQSTLDHLLDVAEKLDVKSLEGAIASVFIRHQIAEEWLFDILELARFYVDLKMYPDRISHINSEGLQLHGLIKELNSLVDFEEKENLVKYAGLVNQYRTKIAHDLLKKDSLDDIQRDSNKFHEHFDQTMKSLYGTENDPYGCRESLLEMIKYFNKWSDAFHDVYSSLLEETLEDLGAQFMSEDEYEKMNKSE